MKLFNLKLSIAGSEPRLNPEYIATSQLYEQIGFFSTETQGICCNSCSKNNFVDCSRKCSRFANMVQSISEVVVIGIAVNSTQQQIISLATSEIIGRSIVDR